MKEQTRVVGATKVDLKKALKQLYYPSAQQVTMVEVPEMNFLMVDGSGDPNTAQAYKEAVEALYTVAYGLKFFFKKEAAIDYAVMPLEGLWWSDEGGREAPRESWQWTMMIMQPEIMTEEWFARALEQAQRKKSLEALGKMRLERLREGLAAQIVHIGPFANEGVTLELLHGFIEERGYMFGGKHHEIYLHDLRRIAPEKMRTILRQPVRTV